MLHFNQYETQMTAHCYLTILSDVDSISTGRKFIGQRLQENGAPLRANC
jgi:hypothetical protein